MKHNLMIQVAIMGMMISMWFLMNEKVNNVEKRLYALIYHLEEIKWKQQWIKKNTDILQRVL